jgi:outer membrane protein OmpA-like peptidoglycan-associated protein/tetratricopeptide (TPR) repeat protein
MKTCVANFKFGSMLMLILLFQFNHLSAQNKDTQYDGYISKAEYHLDSDEYEQALEYLLKADKLKPQNPDLSYRIGICYVRLNHELASLPFLEVAKAGGVKEKELNLHLAEAYHIAHRFDEAIKLFIEYKSTLKSNDPAHAEIDRQITYCKNGKELIKNPVNVKIRNLGGVINSKYPDYVPAISADETVLVFTSRRENTTGGKKDPQDNHYFEDIYISVKSHDTAWTTPLDLGNGINTASHDACVGLSPDGQEMFIYKVTGKDGGDLYVSNLIGSVWSEPKNLGPNINSSAWEPSASITADENTLFFTSNKKGGLGGRDIYMSKKQPNGEFGPAINLGPKINTPYEEDSPFIHADGKTLYFSSKGHYSMGGFDIFSCEIDVETGQIKSEPKNIGYPINTSGDDVFFVWSADNKRAYFSSEREGGYGDKDLYILERDEAKSELVVLKGLVHACGGKVPVAATIIVVDLTTQKPLGVYNSNATTGKYTVILPAGKNYSVTVEAPGYLFYSKNIDIPFLDHYVEMKDTICMEKIKVGTKIVLRNVFFDVDKATLRPESVAELERLVNILNENPHIKIQISGHTDSDGNDAYNLKLSDQRARAVLDYVVTKGIAKDRLVSKGYGETKPFAPNDTPENKQLNRRTEIEVMQE